VVERCLRTAEVRGSTPLTSTIDVERGPNPVVPEALLENLGWTPCPVRKSGPAAKRVPSERPTLGRPEDEALWRWGNPSWCSSIGRRLERSRTWFVDVSRIA
jgi:hypothetical protein